MKLAESTKKTMNLDRFLNWRIPGRRNTGFLCGQNDSPIDAKIILILALYQQGLGAKAISKKLFGSNNSAVLILRRIKEAGVFDSKRKSPVWMGKVHNSITPEVRVRRLMIEASLADLREWMRGVRRYELALYPRHWRAQHNRMLNSPELKIKFYLRKRLRHCVVDKQYSLASLELFGCGSAEIRAHLESKFLPWMNWGNYGKAWHIDHKIPCNAFDLTDPEQAKKCFHFTNLQPMEAKANIRKSDLLPDGSRARNAA